MPSIDLTPTNSLLVALAQEKNARLAGEAQALIDRANALLGDGKATLRAAIERILLESDPRLPNAQVNIENDGNGAPVRLAWEDPPEPPADEPLDGAEAGQPEGALPPAPAQPTPGKKPQNGAIPARTVQPRKAGK